MESNPRGRPRIPVELQRVIAQTAAANRTWGEERISAELRLKLPVKGHLLPRTRRVVSRPILAGLHHECRLERLAS
jgi:hypothetical protein